jgi:hypothetical protein
MGAKDTIIPPDSDFDTAVVDVEVKVKEPMTEEEIHDAAKARLRSYMHWADTDLTENWEDAYRYYKGEYPPPTEATDSTAVSTDVSDTVEWLLPAILKPLIESPDVVRFDPVNPEDQDQADLESDYVHHTFMKKCNGFVKLYCHIKDALLLKNAVFCTYWDEGVKNQKETYRDLTDVELADLLSPADGTTMRVLSVLIREAPLIDPLTGGPAAPQNLLPPRPAPGAPGNQLPPLQGQPPKPPKPQPGVQPPQGAPGQPRPQMGPPGAPMAPGLPPGAMPPPGAMMQPPPPPEPPTQLLYTVEVRRYTNHGRPVVENCRPEAFYVDMAHGSIDLEDARWCAYKMRKSRGDLLALGYDEDLIDEMPKADEWADDSVRREREDVERTFNDTAWGNDTGDPSQDMHDIYRVYMRLDCDGDGFDEQYLIVLGGEDGETMLDYYEVPENPFSASTPFIAAHKFYGYSIYDKVKEIADHKTKVLRMLEDNLDLLNNPRKKVLRGAANLNDVLLSRVGGIWRVDTMDAVQEIATVPINQQAGQLLDYYDKMRSERTGMDPNAQAITNVMPEESMNTAVERILSMKEELVGMMIRTFTETGVKSMFVKLRNLMLRHMPREEMVQLRNKWFKVNPGNWVERANTTVVVGLGTGDRMKKQAGLMNIIKIQQDLAKGGMMGPMVSPERMAFAISELIRASGLGDPDDFLLDPSLLERENINHLSPRGREMMRAFQMKQKQVEQAQQIEQAKQKADQELQRQLIQVQLQMEQVRAQAKLQTAAMDVQQQEKDRWAEMQQFMEENKRAWAQLTLESDTQSAKIAANTANILLQQGIQRVDSKLKREQDQADKAEDRYMAERQAKLDATTKLTQTIIKESAAEKRERVKAEAAQAKQKPESEEMSDDADADD